MKKLISSIYSQEQVFLRELFIKKRKTLGLSQRVLSDRLGVIYSLIGKIETGDRCLDIVEFIQYCIALELEPTEVLAQLQQQILSAKEEKEE
ncbi:helix-turn-helix domain-containing protein [Gallibacterium genomosp. 1]|uniref:DNA-binding protein n=1 Tax=Gallibacterium genomosp. 1 TaxID=155515 RepID=A0AB36DUS5_9PAST|nr:helix-turn-helix transcriptional regulator [Gallibacterium genomosp. 1]OBW99957.1 DNA-binding protein [Gallibacterium genomosp. 1]OBX01446.1 DNA-binding protein [Gallibacterium genomosp. 1]